MYNKYAGFKASSLGNKYLKKIIGIKSKFKG